MANIKREVWKVINSKISEAQEEYNLELDNLKQEHKTRFVEAWENLSKTLANYTAEFKQKKREAFERNVNKVISKII